MWVTEVPGLTLLGNVSLLCLNYLWFSFPIIKAVECCITFYSNVILLELPEMTESSLGKKNIVPSVRIKGQDLFSILQPATRGQTIHVLASLSRSCQIVHLYI